MPTQPNCCLCGEPCEPWPTGDGPPHGYGHNPDPLGTYASDRCCDVCNYTKVIPARLGRMISALSEGSDDNNKEKN